MFDLDTEQQTKVNNWLREHKCRFTPTEDNPFADGAIGGRISYQFTPTGLGVIAVVKCACGDEINVTDFESW